MIKTRRVGLTLLSFILIIHTPLVSCTGSRARSNAPVSPGQNIKIDGLERFYHLYIPSAYKNSEAVPLVIALHGGGGTGKKVNKLLDLNILADQHGFIVAYPDAVDRHWNDGRGVKKYRAQRENIDDVSFISRMIDAIAGKYNIDKNRVYITGASNGAMMSFRLGCDLADKISAIAPVIGSMPENLVAGCTPAVPLPLIMINGTEDPLVPWEGGYVHVYRKKLGKIISVRQTIDFWVARNGCSPDPIRSTIRDTDPGDGTSVHKQAYQQCINDADVVLYEVRGGGHTWPGSYQYLPELFIGKTNHDLDATKAIWDFFNAHPQ